VDIVVPQVYTSLGQQGLDLHDHLLAQVLVLGRDLLPVGPVFGAVLDEVHELLGPQVGWLVAVALGTNLRVGVQAGDEVGGLVNRGDELVDGPGLATVARPGTLGGRLEVQRPVEARRGRGEGLSLLLVGHPSRHPSAPGT
jgi:hypothetical protein